MKHEYDAAMTIYINCFAMFKCLFCHVRKPFPTLFPSPTTNFSEVAFFVPLGNVLSPQFSFEKFLANTRLNLLRVKGQCKLHFSLLSVVFHCCLTFELYSTPGLFICLCSFCLFFAGPPGAPASFMFISAIVSVSLCTLSPLYQF